MNLNLNLLTLRSFSVSGVLSFWLLILLILTTYIIIILHLHHLLVTRLVRELREVMSTKRLPCVPDFKPGQ